MDIHTTYDDNTSVANKAYMVHALSISDAAHVMYLVDVLDITRIPRTRYDHRSWHRHVHVIPFYERRLSFLGVRISHILRHILCLYDLHCSILRANITHQYYMSTINTNHIIDIPRTLVAAKAVTGVCCVWEVQARRCMYAFSGAPKCWMCNMSTHCVCSGHKNGCLSQCVCCHMVGVVSL